ncbi:MAG: UDP-N-acetylmuramoyl-L-alanyl-D-glutamate--2,6-diaminopimelate ligase [Alphaproteobacteria bacterium]|nr:MAG: UDP-N-acetylmuramoyl-L-alanyl-D-glutamate--2,6-diaminopimelate ligase [Alphaproteobacteria bacterium]
MKLSELIGHEGEFDACFAALEIRGIASDSRKVKPGELFVAVPGTKADGLSFVPQAMDAGAAALMAERVPENVPDGVAFVRADNVRRALALAAARFYPRQPATIAAVTGTSGKTSVAAFTRQIWAALGCEAASIGTIGLVTAKEEVYGSLTTPDPVELARTLDRLAEDGITHLAMEASSHGLDQHRIDGVRVTVGGFTNLSRDHLDYHATEQAYLAAKLILFERIVAADGAAVVAADNPQADQVIAAATARGLRALTVGRKGAGIRLIDSTIDGFSQTLALEHAGNGHRVRLPLVGAFQIENALVASGMAIATGSDPAAVFAALEGLEGAKGRLELVGQRNGAPIFVDYAHKPDALAKALDALRPYARRKLIVVFGAGGDRDQGKRPLMGAIAAEKADVVIVTDDNPRSENPAAIRAAILAAASGAGEIGDRGEAIRRSVASLQPGDVLLVAGKGHESGQIVGDRILPFSDHEAVAAALKEKVA